jgi:putative ABC transport system permease protein
MRPLREWLIRLAGTLWPSRRDADLEEELRAHATLAAERGHRVTGTSQAMESLRDQRGVPWLSGLGYDVRLALRSLRGTPVVAVMTVLCLALAIGANTAIFSILNSVRLRSLPVQDASRLVHVTDSVVGETGQTRIRAWSYPVWEQFRQRSGLFAATTAWSPARLDLASGGEAQPVEAVLADGNFFDALGVPIVAGRPFTPADDQRGGGAAGPVAVISHAYWQRQYDGEASAIGRSLRLNDVLFTIVGVASPEFFGLEVGKSFDVVVPLQTEPLIRGLDSALDSAATNFLLIMARLRPDQSLEQAAREVRRVQPDVRAATAGSWEKQLLDRYLTSPFTVLPAASGFSPLRQNLERPLLVLSGVVVLVLLIGCVNVANLLLARAIARRHQFSLQCALGASRWRLARQLFCEALALSMAGAAAGVAIAASGSRFLVNQLSTPVNIVFLDLSLDGPVLVFTAMVTVLTTILFGTAPAFRAASTTIDAMNEARRGGSHAAGDLIGWLIPVQVALSLVLLVAGGLFLRSFVSLSTRPVGFEPERVLVVNVNTERTMVEAMQRPDLFERVRAAVRGVPGVATAAVSFLTPAGSGGFTPAIEVSSPAAPVQVEVNQDVFGNLVSPGWFATLGTAIVAGRDVAEGDRRGAPGVAIVNETFARRFFGRASPLGQWLTVFPGTPRAQRMEIVGVAADALTFSPRAPVFPAWYLPMAQFGPGFPFESAQLSVRSTGDPARLAADVATAVTAVHPRLALRSRPLDDQLRATLARDRLMAQLAGFFAVLALLLATLGLYGVSGYASSRRRSEIGIRLALGAAPASVVYALLARTSRRVGLGLVIGIALSSWAASLVQGLLYDVPARDGTTIGAAALVLGVTGAVAAWLPAWRVSRLDPATVLRAE